MGGEALENRYGTDASLGACYRADASTPQGDPMGTFMHYLPGAWGDSLLKRQDLPDCGVDLFLLET